MNHTFITRGHGYEQSERYDRCTAFDGYEVIANPLGGFDKAARESRVFNRQPNGYGGTCYGSHSIQLARREGGRKNVLYLLLEHGSGREVWQVPTFYDGGELVQHILAMPERAQYALLYTLYAMGRDSRKQAQEETASKWAHAYVEKRIRKRRASRDRRASVYIDDSVKTS